MLLVFLTLKISVNWKDTVVGRKAIKEVLLLVDNDKVNMGNTLDVENLIDNCVKEDSVNIVEV